MRFVYRKPLTGASLRRLLHPEKLHSLVRNFLNTLTYLLLRIGFRSGTMAHAANESFYD